MAPCGIVLEPGFLGSGMVANHTEVRAVPRCWAGFRKVCASLQPCLILSLTPKFTHQACLLVSCLLAEVTL